MYTHRYIYKYPYAIPCIHKLLLTVDTMYMYMCLQVYMSVHGRVHEKIIEEGHLLLATINLQCKLY